MDIYDLIELAEGEPDISNESYVEAVKNNILDTGKRFADNLSGITRSPTEKFEHIENLCRETIEWLEEQNQEHKKLDLSSGWYREFLKTKRWRWWKFYYVLNDDSYQELLKAIDSGDAIRLRKWVNNATVLFSKAVVNLSVSVAGFTHMLIDKAVNARSMKDPNRKISDNYTRKTLGDGNPSKIMTGWNEERSKMIKLIDSLDEHYNEHTAFIRKNKKDLEVVYGELTNSRKISDLIVIVETYRSRCKQIEERIDKHRKKLKQFPINMLVAGIVDLEATVKHIVNLMKK